MAKSKVSYTFESTTVDMLKELAENDSRSASSMLEQLVKVEYEKVFGKKKAKKG